MTMRLTSFTEDPVTVARRLLGQRLVHVVDGRRRAGTIIEVEAYLGAEDRAAHTFGGRRTPRNEAMYLPGGHAYVYVSYGMHHCMNVVCGTRDEGVAVLLRAIEPTEGLEAMRAARPAARCDRLLCSGPGRLTRALGIDRSHDGCSLLEDDTLFIEKLRHRALPSHQIVACPRIGIESAGDWADRPLRFLVAGHRGVSRPPARSRGS